jgi:hypothetical protein
MLGAILAGLWLAVLALVLIGYHPGGPADGIVGVAAFGPILIALAAVAWPPVANGGRAFAGIAWLALGAILLLVPSLGGLIGQLAAGGPQTLLPSPEAAYPWALALSATALYAGFGLARRRLGETALRRRRLVLGTAIGLVLAVSAGTTFTAAAVVNELALRDQPSAASRFGPTDPTLEPPPCDGTLSAGSTARLDLSMDEAIDGRRAGQVSVSGVRNGADVRWSGFAATRLMLGQVGAARIGDRAWVLNAGSSWAITTLALFGGRDLDAQLVSVALSPGNRAVAEDRGLAFIEGARARHCRVAIDGITLREAMPEIDLLVGSANVSRWRGDLDFWIFADGELGQADALVSGPATALAPDALLATLRFRLTAVDRGSLVMVLVPPT